MRAIGNTKLDENDNIGALLGQLPNQAEKSAANLQEIPAAEKIPEKTQKGKKTRTMINLNTTDLLSLPIRKVNSWKK